MPSVFTVSLNIRSSDEQHGRELHVHEGPIVLQQFKMQFSFAFVSRVLFQDQNSLQWQWRGKGSQGPLCMKPMKDGKTRLPLRNQF